ncbi:MAG TPA: sodium-dependent transporter [Elusimicrobiota bacterium]|nr:sodium-dependent transporter [Elusimicrobiota bacterium]
MEQTKTAPKREGWGSKLGVILAVAGSAVGLGNFLRFPSQAALNGGGAFMIPYFISLLILGIPLMWVEWTIGRYGGGFGHGSAPGIFHTMWKKNRFIKYFGVLGIFAPIVILSYYTYIESWLLGYAWFSVSGKLSQVAATEQGMRAFLTGYQGLLPTDHFSGLGYAYLFFLITFALNAWVIYRGLKGGIEKLCNWAMPTLVICGIILTVRVLTIGTPHPETPDNTILNGLGYLWNPDFKALTNAKVWLAAAGQIFFTLSIGFGVIMTYASYLNKREDVALSGLTASATNEFVEVILGGSIVIPAAFAFFGSARIVEIAQSGSFNIGFVTMPMIFNQIPAGMCFASIWYGLLFLAGITSSVSMAIPAIAFLEDEFNISRKKAALITIAIVFFLCQPAILFLGRGVMDELDFWGGTFCLILAGAIEAILFSWVFGMDKAWEEMHHGAEMSVPSVFKFILRYITPVYLLAILGFWLYQEGWPVILMQGVSVENRPFILWTRIGLLLFFGLLSYLVWHAWKKRSTVTDP